MNLNRISYYKVALILTAVALAIWQFQIVTGKESQVRRSGSPQLTFTMNSGAKVTLPDTTNRYSIVVFWKVSSDRSLKQVAEALDARKLTDIDTLATFYLVNLQDSLPQIKNTVDFDNPQLPFAYAPTGGFMDQYQIRALPLTIIFSADGTIVDSYEGYREGNFQEAIKRIVQLNQMVGKGGSFKFPIQ